MSERNGLVDLLARVEAASGPDRELDALIDAIVVNDREIVERVYLPTGTPCLCARFKKPPHDEYVVWCAEATDLVRVRNYTASIDAALALVERVLPGAEKDFSSDTGLRGDKWVATLTGQDFCLSGCATTLPLAILAATLRALSRPLTEAENG